MEVLVRQFFEVFPQPTLDNESVIQDEQNAWLEGSLVAALHDGYLSAFAEDSCLVNSYRELCKEEQRVYVRVYTETGRIAIRLASREELDIMMPIAREQRAEEVGGDRNLGEVELRSEADRGEGVAKLLVRALLHARAPGLELPTSTSAPVTTIDVAHGSPIALDREQLMNVKRALALGFLVVNPAFAKPLNRNPEYRLYVGARVNRDRPCICLMPAWGRTGRTLIVSSINRLALRHLANAAHETAKVVVDAEAIGIIAAVVPHGNAETVAQTLADAWTTYEMTAWPRPETPIETELARYAAI